MPRILAIDWDRHEVRAVLVGSAPTGVAVTGAWAASLDRPETSPLSGKQIGERLAAAMASHVGGKLTTLVGVGRDNVQMQLLTLPPAPPEELPELVRFQAEREFTALGSDAALDFIPIAGDSQTPHHVLAVALNATGLSEAREVCQAIGVQLNRIPLRACAAAAFVYRAGAVADDRVALIVNPLTDEADLTVHSGDKVILMRTVRLPPPLAPPEIGEGPGEGQADARQRALVGEIRRTMAAVRQQSADRKVEQVIVCGSRATSDEDGGLSDELEVPVTVFDPTSHSPPGLSKQGVALQSLGRFAAVLGMALGEADRQRPIVDFANVRRRREAPRFTRVHMLAATAAAVALLWFAAHLWRQIAEPARELAQLESRIQDVQAQAETYKDITAQAAAIERWLATDVNWLDELEHLARRVRPKPLADDNFPADDDVVVTQLTMLRPPGTDAIGGRIDLQAKAKSDTAIRDLEQRLRDERHRVAPGGLQEDKTVPGYPRAFDLQVHILSPSDPPHSPPQIGEGLGEGDSAEATP